MISFIVLFIHRTLSGMQNGYGYSRDRDGMIMTTAAMCIVLLFGLAAMRVMGSFPHSAGGFVIVGYCVSVLTAVLVWRAFEEKRDIHLWELLATSTAFLTMIISGGDILGCIFSVYPALILHKGFINVKSGLSFLDTRTDDPTGKTFGIPSLGIKIPRNGNTTRFILAGLSLVGAVLLLFGVLRSYRLWEILGIAAVNG